MDDPDHPSHSRPTAEDLLRALESRDVIGQAKGILMERHRLTAEDAFDRIKTISQNSNTKVVDVAKAITTQDRPDTMPDALSGTVTELHGVALRPQELQILRLIVDGCTNAQIAEKLYIGLETVRTHVSHLFAKIGVTNRTQAAMWAVRPGYRPPRIDAPVE